MALKPRYKRRIFWTIIVAIGLFITAFIIIPPLITLNSLKPKIQQTIADQTGIDVQIKGDINFSLLGRATIVVHDIVLPIGTVGSAMFSIPLHDIFNPQGANLGRDVIVYDANVQINSLVPQNFSHQIVINNSTIRFMGKDYSIIRATLQAGRLSGTVRTPDHKYDITFDNDAFFIRNQNNRLEISGHLYSDGTARGVLAIATNKINDWFEFQTPRITDMINMTMNFTWDGGYGFDFTNIVANDFSGDILLRPDGAKVVKLRSNNMNFDFSFLLESSNLFFQTDYDLDFYGDMRFGDQTFKHFKVIADGETDRLNITEIVADDMHISGGYIDANGAHDILIKTPMDGVSVSCLFSGTPTDWKCSDFSYGILSGSLSVKDETFNIFVQSDKPLPNREALISRAYKLGRQGKLNFQFSDIGGTFDIAPTQNISSFYTFAKNRPLNWFSSEIKFIPSHMLTQNGDFTRFGDTMQFRPSSGKWFIELKGNDFHIWGDSIKEWFPTQDLQALNDTEYDISGTFKGNTISNLVIKISGQEFTGSATDNSITLKTDILNLDSFLNQNFIDNYSELEFITTSPIMLPFGLGINLSLSASSIIYNGNEYKNFVYALKPTTQTFSITDSSRGNLLATIYKRNNQYDISIQLNKFLIQGPLLSSQMPLNVIDTLITADIKLNTWGHIAHDLEYNLSGDIDILFTDGYLKGIGVDGLFASAPELTALNAEFILSDALEGGTSALKKLHIVGTYKNGDFQTTRPLELQLHHTDISGSLDIKNGAMGAHLNLILRGTSPKPSPIDLEVLFSGSRRYSLSQIMTNFDPSYTRDFVLSHNRF